MALATDMVASRASRASQARVEDTPMMVTDTQDTTAASQENQARVEDTVHTAALMDTQDTTAARRASQARVEDTPMMVTDTQGGVDDCHHSCT